MLSFLIRNVYFFVLEEEWNPDGKGRNSNDTGELYHFFMSCLLKVLGEKK